MCSLVVAFETRTPMEVLIMVGAPDELQHGGRDLSISRFGYYYAFEISNDVRQSDHVRSGLSVALLSCLLSNNLLDGIVDRVDGERNQKPRARGILRWLFLFFLHRETRSPPGSPLIGWKSGIGCRSARRCREVLDRWYVKGRASQNRRFHIPLSLVLPCL